VKVKNERFSNYENIRRDEVGGDVVTAVGCGDRCVRGATK
jgi:hypothetical protein